MIKSMTGFASANGSHQGATWSLEVRAVNGRGLDLRLRVPDWIDGLEAGLRSQIAAIAARGTVTCALRVARDEQTGGVTLNVPHLDGVLAALTSIEAVAKAHGLTLAPSKAADIAALRGVLEQSSPDEDTAALRAHLLSAAEAVLGDFDAMRTAEGAALAKILAAQIAEVAQLVESAEGLLEQRSAQMAQALAANLARVLNNTEGASSDRVAQELAMIGVKADVTEELDRLRTHVATARDLLVQGGTIGRKLDFLIQEFNREANTLCAKAQMKELTAVGLSLKAVIDQMREQVQNVE
ncbi:MAG: YicC/YloC family endoribonuclease [Pseudomonadota bacterium]